MWIRNVYFSDEFIEIMEQFKCGSLVNKNNVKEVIVESSKQELYRMPQLMASCWIPVLSSQGKVSKSRWKLIFISDTYIYIRRSLYQTLEPTNKKVISCIIASPQDEVERECLQYFNKYIISLDTIMLKYLLCFLIEQKF